MQTRQLRLVLSLMLTLCVFHDTQAQQAGRIESMKLLTADTGWAATNKTLFWTTDGGASWKDITPRTTSDGAISSVFFLDPTRGWALISCANEGADQPVLELASTSTAGSTWSVTRVKLPQLDPKSTTITGDGYIDFVDPNNGWLSLSVASSSNFRLGLLALTKDGGRTWGWPEDAPGVNGRIHFIGPKDGWLAGGPGDEHLYATHDGSASWQELSLQAPPLAGKAVWPTYDQPPTFDGKGEGFISVTFSGPNESKSALVLYASADGGRTWTPRKTILSQATTSPGQVFPTAMAGSVLMTAHAGGQTPSVTMIAPESSGPSPNMEASAPGSLQLSFQDSSRGWVLANGRLFSTSDSGVTWANVSPASVAQPLPKPSTGIHLSPDRKERANVAPPSTAVAQSAHLGFHMCNAATSNQMGTWATSSPFYEQ